MSVDVYNALSMYLSGAVSDGADQGDTDLSLGGFRSSQRAGGMGFIVEKSIPFLQIDFVSEQNGMGLGFIETVGGTSLRWVSPNGLAGESLAVTALTPIKLSSGTDDEKYIIVTLTKDVQMTGSAAVRLVKKFNNAVGFSNVSGDQRISGVSRLRCLVLKNQYSETVKDIKVYIQSFSEAVVSNEGQLSLSGAGVIETTGSFLNWPQSGFCRIETAAGVEKEIVYYKKRSDTALTIEEAGRQLLGTSAAAGAANDNLYNVPGMKIACEPDNSGFTLASSQTDTASVSGLTFKTAITAAGGLDVGDLIAGQMVAIWLWYDTIAGQLASAAIENAIALEYTVGAVTVKDRACGLYRIGDSALDRYELYYGLNDKPDFSQEPIEIFSELPYELTRFQTIIEDGKFLALGELSPWNIGANWTIEELEEGVYGAECSNAGGAGYLGQDCDISAAAEYELTFTALVTGVISVAAKVGGSVGTPVNISGTYTELVTAIDISGLSFSVAGTPGAGSVIIKDVILSLKRTGRHFFSLRKRNAYNLISQNNDYFEVALNAMGMVVIENPSGPVYVTLTATKKGEAAIEAMYSTPTDNLHPATHWLIYSTSNGADPDPEVDTAEVVEITINRGVAVLNYTTDPTDVDNTIKVLVRTAVIKNEDCYESGNSDIYSIIAVRQTLAMVKGNVFLGNINEVVI